MPGPPIVAVPTTAGTGAEVTAVAMLWHDGGKRMFVHPHLVPRVVLIDPELLLGLPPSVTASGGFDAIGHAVESLLSTFRTPVTIARRPGGALAAVRGLACGVRDTATSSRATARRSAPTRPGLALNASVVLGHSLAYAIASRTGLPHGVTVAMALPYCLAHARPACEEQIADMAEIVCGRARPRALRPVDRRAQPPDGDPDLARGARSPARGTAGHGSGLRRELPTAEPSGADRPRRRAGPARADVRRRALRSLAGLLSCLTIDSEAHA